MALDMILNQIGGALDKKTALDNFNKLYSASPEYAQGYYGTLNANRMTDLKEQELMREQQRKDALRQLASGIGRGRVGAGGIVPTGINPAGQAELNQKLGGGSDFLSQYAQITGDLSPLVMMERERAMSTLPSAGGTQAVLAERLMAENPNMKFSDALRQIQMGIREGIDFEGGQATPRMDIGTARGTVGGLEKYGTEMGGMQAELEMKPRVEMATKEAAEVGKNIGEARAEYADLSAAYPQLIDTTDRLSRLAQVATYSKAGRLSDAFKRQLGVEVGTPAEAAAEMATTIDVEVLPLLKPTFGAAFTVNEGEWLRNTMGNPDLSPEEKIKQIEARVRGWNNRVKTLENRLNVPEEERLGVVNPSIKERTQPVDRKEALRQEAIRRGLIQ